jgi:hypothetical protein
MSKIMDNLHAPMLIEGFSLEYPRPCDLGDLNLRKQPSFTVGYT